MIERRSEQRLLCSQLVGVQIRRPGKRSRRLTAVMEDVSPAGACVQTDEALGVATSVELAISTSRFPGTVRYCVQRETGYFIGIQFEAGVRWSSELIAPEHLLDPHKVKGPRRRG